MNPYDITQIGVLEQDTVQGMWNSLVQIDATHYMLAYQGDGADGYIKTFSIDGSYNITEIDVLEHDTDFGSYNSLVQIDATHFILAYAGTTNHGHIKTFSIDGSYNITQIDELEHDTAYGIYNSLVQIDATHFILAYTGEGNDGYLKTFSIHLPVYAISGVVTKSGTPQSGATVRLIDQTTNTTETPQTTDANGAYTFEDLDPAKTYHVVCEFSDETSNYYTYSYWNITPYELT